jgi:hypothetical protein
MVQGDAMPAKSYVWIFLALLAGILIGRISVTDTGVKTATETEYAPGQRRADSPGISHEDSAANPRARRSAERASESGKITIPLETGKELLAKGSYLDCSFEVMDGRIGKALGLLGATARQQEEAEGIFRRTKDELLAAEKEHVGVRTSGPSEIYLNMFDVEDATEAIIRKMREDLRAALGPEQAEALTGSINWSNFYRTGYLEEVRLEVVRQDGALYRSERSAGYSRRSRLGNDSFPLDSQSIPAHEAFKAVDHPDARFRSRDWSHLLQGKDLVPVDGPPTTGG